MHALATTTSAPRSNNRVLEFSGSRVTYRGQGYLYHFRKNAEELIAKLKMGKAMMDQFTKRCGFVNTRGLPGLTVACQGGGWFEVFAIEAKYQISVLNFLKRLNLWVWRQSNPVADPKAEKKLHYTVEARVFDLKKPKDYKASQPCPSRQRQFAPLVNRSMEAEPVTPSKLQDMVARFNAKYGKK